MGYSETQLKNQLLTIICGEENYLVKSKKGIVKYLNTRDLVFNAFKEKIGTGSFAIPQFTNQKQFNNLLACGGGQTKSSVFWTVMISIAKEIEKDNLNNYSDTSSYEKYVGSGILKEEVIFAFHSFPDTKLPYYFRAGLSNGINLKFQEMPGWSSSISLFTNTEKEIETNIIHAHTLSQALFLEKKLNRNVVFIPLFEFTGYGLAIKESFENPLREILKIGQNWKNILLNNDFHIIVETKSDFHFMLLQYLKKYNFSPEELSTISSKIISTETSKGKELFKNKEKALLYSTNWVHFESLKKDNPNGYFIVKGNNFYKHNNLNGFIFLEEFYNKNKPIIEKLYFNWLDSIRILNNDFVSEIDNDSPYFIKDSQINKYCINIKDSFGVEISPVELKNKFEVYNKFYTTQKEIINSISPIITDDDKMISDYLNIIDMSSREINTNSNELQELINRSINIIKEL